MMKKTAFGYGFGLSPVAFSTACSLRLLSSSAVSSSVSLNAVISSALSASSRGLPDERKNKVVRAEHLTRTLQPRRAMCEKKGPTKE
uniref:Putative secreted protein n=1 Tax=Ixodes ricinus TaxID=34613 RepID=A0A6B0TZ97_IXORI